LLTTNIFVLWGRYDKTERYLSPSNLETSVTIQCSNLFTKPDTIPCYK